MSATQLRFKFKNGDVVTHTDFGEMAREQDDKDLIKIFEEIKLNDAPITLEDRGGATYQSSGKELISVEIIL